jgi:hypothetical protein
MKPNAKLTLMRELFLLYKVATAVKSLYQYAR